MTWRADVLSGITGHPEVLFGHVEQNLTKKNYVQNHAKLPNAVATTTAEHQTSSVTIIRDISSSFSHQTNTVDKTAPVNSSSVQSKHTCWFRESRGKRLRRLRSPCSSCQRLPAEQHQWRSDPGDDISHLECDVMSSRRLVPKILEKPATSFPKT